MELSPPKGMKDCLPEEQILIQKLLGVIRETFEKYGFVPLDTPALERLEILEAKGGGGSEIGKEIFRLKDRAGRNLGLRFDLTLPLARVVARNPTIPIPFKRYQIGKVWRQEFGTRMREFWQCDIDTVGSASPIADAEMLQVAQDIFKKLRIKIRIKINSRVLLKKVLEKAGVPGEKQTQTIIEIDKLEKGRGQVPQKVLRALKSAKPSDDPFLAEVIRILRKLGVKVEFDPSLARGLEYYTGPVWEIFSEKYKYSLAGGGRYDNLLKLFGGRNLPATGMSFGITRICEVLLNKGNKRKTLTQVFVIPIGNTTLEVARICQKLREVGINTDFDVVGRDLRKNLNYVNKLKIPYVIFVGEKELKEGRVKLKDMRTGEEVLLSQNLKEVLKLINPSKSQEF